MRYHAFHCHVIFIEYQAKIGKVFTFRQLLPTYLRGSFQSLSTWTLTASWRGRKSCSLSGGEVWEMTETCWQCRQCSQQRLLTEWRGEATEQKTSITSTMKQGETRLNNVKQHETTHYAQQEETEETWRTCIDELWWKLLLAAWSLEVAGEGTGAAARSLCKRRTWKSLKITWKITDVCLAGAWPVVVAECVASLGLHCVDHIAASLFLGLQALKVEDESFVAELIHRAVREWPFAFSCHSFFWKFV